MRIDRMFGILTVLLNRDRVKAKDLAERFEVSIRTIHRDIEAIGQAGIPVVTYPGTGGGVGIMPDFKLDKSVFSPEEMNSIVAGLKGLASVSDDVKIRTLLAKLVPREESLLPLEHDIIIDLSTWNKKSRVREKINLLRTAIAHCRYVSVHYFSGSGYSQRQLEPYKLIFKDTNWYLYAYCLRRNDLRLFKLSRMSECVLEGEHFQPRALSPQLINSLPLKWEGELDNRENSGGENIVLEFHPSQRYLVMDIFGADGFTESDNGALIVRFTNPNLDWVTHFVLGFGDKIEVLAPQNLRKEIGEQAERIMELYLSNKMEDSRKR